MKVGAPLFWIVTSHIFVERIPSEAVLRGGVALTWKANILASSLWVLLAASALFTQEKAPPSKPRPAPRVTGTLIDTDGVRRLTLAYHRDSRAETFTGTIHSTCMLASPSGSGERKPLDLSAIPMGTSMTFFYVRHVVGKEFQNVILAVRFDHVRHGSTLPQGISIPCFKAAQNPAPR
jgi:hypothetical protein